MKLIQAPLNQRMNLSTLTHVARARLANQWDDEDNEFDDCFEDVEIVVEESDRDGDDGDEDEVNEDDDEVRIDNANDRPRSLQH